MAGFTPSQPKQADSRPLLSLALLIDFLLAILTLAAGVLDRLPSPLLSAAPILVIAPVLIDTAAARPSVDSDPAGLEPRHRLKRDLPAAGAEHA